MNFWKNRFPLIITFVFGILGLVQYYIPHPVSEHMFTNMSEWLRIISGFAMILGVASLCHVHFTKIKRKVAGWGYSMVVYVSMIATILIGITANGKEEGTGFGWIYSYVMVALQGTMFSILAFYVASAAYRAFRAKSKEAAILLVTAIIVMFGRVPLGEYILPFSGDVSNWILNVPNTAARRGIIIGISFGIIATSLKIIFGIERTYLGRKE